MGGRRIWATYEKEQRARLERKRALDYRKEAIKAILETEATGMIHTEKPNRYRCTGCGSTWSIGKTPGGWEPKFCPHCCALFKVGRSVPEHPTWADIESWVGDTYPTYSPPGNLKPSHLFVALEHLKKLGTRPTVQPYDRWQLVWEGKRAGDPNSSVHKVSGEDALHLTLKACAVAFGLTYEVEIGHLLEDADRPARRR